MISIRRICIGEGVLFREVRLAALSDSPDAFSTTYAFASERSIESWSLQADGAALGDRRATFLAFSENVPVGIASIYQTEEESDKAELIHVWLSPRYRGSGVADKMIAEALNWAVSVGFDNVYARVMDKNMRALAFYAKQGFLRVSQEAGEVLLRKNSIL